MSHTFDEKKKTHRGCNPDVYDLNSIEFRINSSVFQILVIEE